jgi:hypothetical protein
VPLFSEVEVSEVDFSEVEVSEVDFSEVDVTHMSPFSKDPLQQQHVCLSCCCCTSCV